MAKATQTFKSTTHHDHDVEKTDKSARDSDLGHDGPNLLVPIPSSRSSSRNSPSPSLLSSPQPLLSANDSGKVTDSSNPETGDHTDLDDTSFGKDAMILDTSRASWNQPLGSPAIPQSPELLPPRSDSGDDGHVRKKRKSDIGVVVSGRDDVCIDHPSEDEEPDCDQTNRKNERSVLQTFPSKGPATLSKISVVPRKSQKDLRQRLRGRLVGYARTGSQISGLPEKSDLSEDEEDEEVDQLLSDAVDVSGDLPAHRSTELASASVQDAVIDDVQDPGPPVRTSALNSMDLALGEDDDAEDPSSLLSQARASSLATSSTISHKDKVYRPEIIRSETTGADISLKFNINDVKQVWANRPKKGQGKRRELILEEVLVDAGVANTENDRKAVDALSRVIEKDDFATMDIVGQFNLGFIVVRRKKTAVSDDDDDLNEMDDLFIVDQHAADEKYNFETLQSTTVIQSQKLLRRVFPFCWFVSSYVDRRRQPLELTAADEMLAMENIEVLRQNGFEIEVDECASVGLGSRLHVAALPTSRSTVFDMKGQLSSP